MILKVPALILLYIILVPLIILAVIGVIGYLYKTKKESEVTGSKEK
jgi:uncharacterized protein (UPF0333 family)